ncbi:hypothetical protein ACC779_37095 [Rhizobium ruizarguesonis]
MEKFYANFDVADDILQEATRGKLSSHGSIVIEKSRRIGPTVELALAAFQFQEQYRLVTINSEFSDRLSAALQTGHSFGGGFHDVVGAFPLGAENPIATSDAEWDQWTIHAENMAKASGLNAQLIASLMGAMVELQDNIYEHSGAPETGLVAYAVTRNSFEFVVADRGVGVLKTLRQNSRYSAIPDAGAALQEVIKDGVSRFPSETGRGQGFSQLFRALVGRNAELRFRSGDHALTMRPTSDALHGETILAQVPSLNGLTISVFHNVNGA